MQGLTSPPGTPGKAPLTPLPHTLMMDLPLPYLPLPEMPASNPAAAEALPAPPATPTRATSTEAAPERHTSWGSEVIHSTRQASLTATIISCRTPAPSLAMSEASKGSVRHNPGITSTSDGSGALHGPRTALLEGALTAALSFTALVAQAMPAAQAALAVAGAMVVMQGARLAMKAFSQGRHSPHASPARL
jgi:hypothetical protein